MTSLLSGEFVWVSEKAPKLAGEFVIFKGMVGAVAKVARISVAGQLYAEQMIWPTWLEAAPRAGGVGL